jgi:hypothetical protein
MVTAARPSGIGAVDGAATCPYVSSRCGHSRALPRQFEALHRGRGNHWGGDKIGEAQDEDVLSSVNPRHRRPGVLLLKKNLKIKIAPEVPFESKRRQHAPRPNLAATSDVDDCVGLRDVIPKTRAASS